MTEHDDALAGPTDELTVIDDTALNVDEPFSVEDVLAMAERVQRTASICLRASLQGEWDRLMDELTTLITPDGEVIAAAEAAAGDVTPESRAMEILDRLNAIRADMRKAMWHVTFEAMASDDWATFLRLHKPKQENADHTDFYNRLMAETAISPTLSMDQIKALRKKLGPSAIAELITTARDACVKGGLDVPKLPVSLQILAGESSVN